MNRFISLYQSLLERYTHLSRKEKDYFLATSSTITLLCCYAFIWLPINNWTESQIKKHENQQQTFQWINQQLKNYQVSDNNQHKIKSINIMELSNIFLRYANKNKISINHSHIEQNTLLILLNEVNYQQLINIIFTVIKNYQVNIEEIKIDRSNQEQGKIKANIKLSV